MKWKEVTLHTTHEAIEPIINILQNHLITGVSIKEPLRKHEESNNELYALNPEEYPKHGVYITFYLPKETNTDDQLSEIIQEIDSLSRFHINLGSRELFIKEIKEEDWENEWKKYYQPIQVSSTITVTPYWEKYIPKFPNEKIIKLDPGMAFGTGMHPSTKLSIKNLEKYFTKGSSVIDVGCGSGILSIVSAKLGAKKVISLDIDPLAIKSTTHNAKLNKVEHRLIVKQNDLLKGIDLQIDVIVANILAEVIVLFPKDAYKLLKEGGYFITSGIINEKEVLVRESLEKTGFTIIDRITEDHWISLVATK